jgi:hypothetical protein
MTNVMESNGLIQDSKYLNRSGNVHLKAFSWQSIYGSSKNANLFIKAFVAEKYPHFYAPLVYILISPLMFFIVDFTWNLFRTYITFISNKFTLVILFLSLFFALDAAHLVGRNFGENPTLKMKKSNQLSKHVIIPSSSE